MPLYEYVIVIGCGRLGSLLATRLSNLDCNVVVIDKDEHAFNNLFTGFNGFKIVGDATELAVLRRAKIDKADCLLATTNLDNLNLMVAQIARSIFQVPKVMARICDPSREAIYSQFEIETISPTKLSAELFLAALQKPEETGHSSWSLF